MLIQHETPTNLSAEFLCIGSWHLNQTTQFSAHHNLRTIQHHPSIIILHHTKTWLQKEAHEPTSTTATVLEPSTLDRHAAVLAGTTRIPQQKTEMPNALTGVPATSLQPNLNLHTDESHPIPSPVARLLHDRAGSSMLLASLTESFH